MIMKSMRNLETPLGESVQCKYDFNESLNKKYKELVMMYAFVDDVVGELGGHPRKAESFFKIIDKLEDLNLVFKFEDIFKSLKTYQAKDGKEISRAAQVEALLYILFTYLDLADTHYQTYLDLFHEKLVLGRIEGGSDFRGYGSSIEENLKKSFETLGIVLKREHINKYGGEHSGKVGKESFHFTVDVDASNDLDF